MDKDEHKKIDTEEIIRLTKNHAVKEELEIEQAAEVLMSQSQNFPDIAAHVEKIMHWQSQKTTCSMNIANSLKYIKNRLEELKKQIEG